MSHHKWVLCCSVIISTRMPVRKPKNVSYQLGNSPFILELTLGTWRARNLDSCWFSGTWLEFPSHTAMPPCSLQTTLHHSIDGQLRTISPFTPSCLAHITSGTRQTVKRIVSEHKWMEISSSERHSLNFHGKLSTILKSSTRKLAHSSRTGGVCSLNPTPVLTNR